MVVIFLTIVSILFLIYGGLVISGLFVPISSKILIEDEDRGKWCKTEGFTKILWGLDLAFLSMHLQGIFPAFLWFICFLVMTVYIILMAYKNNQKYMK